MAVQKTRNYGIDLFKIFAMFMVTVYHVIGHGGVLRGVEGKTFSYEAVTLLRILGCCAVNCFAMASGYVQVESQHRYRRLVPLHLRVLFYSVTITAGAYILSRGAVGEGAVIRAFFPASFRSYWYYTAYFGLFFLIPFMNEAMHRLDRKSLRRMVVTLLILFTSVPYITRSPIFSLEDGYSLLWLCTMYLLGAYLRKIDGISHISTKMAWALLALSLVAAWISRPIVAFAGIVFSGSPGQNTSWFAFSYLSPATVLRSVALLILFAKIQIRKDALKKWVGLFSAGSFSVYLIHDHPLVRETFITGQFRTLGDGSAVGTLLGVIGIALCINGVCYAVDALRDRLFRVTKISYLGEVVWDKTVHALYMKIHYRNP